MSFSFLKRAGKKDFLVLDIGTETVKALIFEKIGEKNTLLAASLEYFDNFDLFDSKNFEAESIKETISRAIQSLGAKELPENIFLGLPAAILKGKIFFQSFGRKKSKEPINDKEAELISQEVLKNTKRTISQQAASESGILPKDIHFISLKILEIKIDGYEVPTLQGYNGENLVFRILIIFTLKDYFKNVERIAQAFNFKNFEILHLAEGLSKIQLPTSENSIFLDIGGETTQIFLIKDGKLERIKEFEAGGKDFSRALSQTLGLRENEGRELKERYSKKLLSIETKNRISEILVKPQKEWYENLKARIKEINLKGLLPSIFFIFGGGSLLPGIQEILENGDWENFRFVNKPETKLICPKDCYPPLNLKEEKLLTFVMGNSQYTSSFLIYYAGKNF